MDIKPVQTDEQLQLQAQRVSDAFAKAYNKKHGTKVPVPVPLGFELELTKPKWAGAAHPFPLKVELNMTLYRDNVKETLNETIPHEVAHLAQFCIDRKKQVSSTGHGPLWQSLMESMAKRPLKTHSMSTAKAVTVFNEHKKAKKKARDVQEKAA